MNPEVIYALVVGGIVSLVGKIIFDWLNGKRGNGEKADNSERKENSPYCPEHDRCMTRMDTHETKIEENALKLSTQSAKCDARYETTRDRLDRGDQKMNEMTGQISELQKFMQQGFGEIKTDIGILGTKIDNLSKKDPS